MLESCAVFDLSCSTDRGCLYQAVGDYLTLPDGLHHQGSDCPAGVLLAPGDALSWVSDHDYQGNYGTEDSSYDNGFGATGTCGQPQSTHALGGGWVVCFA